MVKVAKLECNMEKLCFANMDDIMEKFGGFQIIKHQLEEQGSQVSNQVHKLLGNLPSSFESFKAIGLLHDKLLS